ncbi:rhodanese-like domain-containing protein [Tropicibacter naphthalenivorans]|uniref:Molybdopterin biosynthesis protein MoeB n=1 Tax=Tropicibacter naphthalenivorans TaxID=441103 RepID=A0A0P1GEK8_9RHOB|nr:rhodanese-like domain-containing protein [Tropicibacter naphthalenivorans]CUH80046.1 molybdopterin biosynthesis protein MoeB [Tropicibacter naphthalenivorans]SMC83721.1 Rhodanese-related sulfurtransferase [Tropicibacter naphthalenivorans]
MRTPFIAAAITAILAAPLAAQDLVDEITGYIEFEPYDSGIIVPEQLTEDVWADITFVDTRDAAQFAAGTIPGAIHMEWREVPGRLDELPTTGKVVLFCNTGSLSAQATFAARLLGHDNVVVLQTGILGWRENGAYHPG